MAVYAEAPWQQTTTLVASWHVSVKNASGQIATLASSEEAGKAAGSRLSDLLGIDANQAEKTDMRAILTAATDEDMADFEQLLAKISGGEVKDSASLIADMFARQALRPDGQQLLHEQLISSMQDTLEEASAVKEAQAGNPSHSLTPSHFTSPSDRSIMLIKADAAGFTGNETATEQVSISIERAIKEGRDRIAVELHPAGRGRVEVRLDVLADGRTHVVVNADNKDTLDQLQRDAKWLEKALQNAGLEANAQDMAFNLQKGRDESGEQEMTTTYQAGLEESEAQDNMPIDSLSGTYTLNLQEGLDIKV